MKNLIKIIIPIFTLLLLWSCADDDELTVLNPDIQNTTSLSMDKDGELILDKTNAEQIAVTATWDEPDFGYNAVPDYSILITEKSTGLTTTKNIGDKLTYSFTNQTLNNILMDMELEPNNPYEVNFQLLGKVGNETVINSNIETLIITPYSSILDLSTTWGIVGSAAPNGWDGPDVPFYKTKEKGVLVAYANLNVGEIKFRENNAWDTNYGDDGADGILELGAANIIIAKAGSYKITWDINTMSYTIQEFSLGVVGTATPNGWDGSDIELSYDSYSDTFKGITTLDDGVIKFRLNNEWATNYGSGDVEGALELDGNEISVSKGNYIITVDLNEMTYNLEAIENIWGIVGSATPNGWDGPDIKFTRDWSQPDKDLWVAKNVSLEEGVIKFRANNDWAINYGDDDADGSLELGGADIPVAAGTYDISLDFSSDTPIYIIE